MTREEEQRRDDFRVYQLAGVFMPWAKLLEACGDDPIYNVSLERSIDYGAALREENPIFYQTLLETVRQLHNGDMT